MRQLTYAVSTAAMLLLNGAPASALDNNDRAWIKTIARSYYEACLDDYEHDRWTNAMWSCSVFRQFSIQFNLDWTQDTSFFQGEFETAFQHAASRLNDALDESVTLRRALSDCQTQSAGGAGKKIQGQIVGLPEPPKPPLRRQLPGG